MPLDRVLEPEVMDSPEEATDYDAMDHREVNRVFVDDLLARVQSSGFGVQAEGLSMHGTEYSVLCTECAETGAPADDPESKIEKAKSRAEPRTLNPEPFLDILDLGTGTALIPIELCKRFADCRIMAADAAVSMLELARYNIEVNSLIERIQLAQVDAKRLPLGDQMFDVTMSNSIIHHIPGPIGVLREAVRVTRPGGMLFFRDLLRPETNEQLQQLVTTYAGGANEHQRRMFAESLHAALSLAEIRGLVSSLGFGQDTVNQTSDRHWTWVAALSRR